MCSASALAALAAPSHAAPAVELTAAPPATGAVPILPTLGPSLLYPPLTGLTHGPHPACTNLRHADDRKVRIMTASCESYLAMLDQPHVRRQMERSGGRVDYSRLRPHKEAIAAVEHALGLSVSARMVSGRAEIVLSLTLRALVRRNRRAKSSLV